jgi:hypothetical protein
LMRHSVEEHRSMLRAAFFQMADTANHDGGLGRQKKVGEGARIGGVPDLIRPDCLTRLRCIFCHFSGSDTPS